jgi:prophage antirepressor-like protein
MDIVKAFNSNELHTEIIIKGDIQNPLFRASDIGIVLDISTIRSVIRDFNETEKVVLSTHTLGGLQDVTFLTEKGLYKVLFKSRKPIAEKFQDWICEVIKELRLKGTYNLQQQLEQKTNELNQLEISKNKEMEEKLAFQQVIEKEKILLKEYSNSGALVYIIKVKSFSNGEYIVKIGHSTKGIHDRYSEHKGKYNECLLLNCFLVNKSNEFENFLHNHEDIRQNKVNDLLGHENEKELFLIGKKLTYQIVLKIINNNIQNYNYSVSELLKEIELLNHKLTLDQSNNINNDNENIKELLKIVNTLNRKIDNLEKSNQEIMNKLNSQQTKITTGFNQQLPTLGPRVQKINPETMQLVKVYESVTEVMNENKDIKRPSINKAVQENTIYCGFRWLLVERNLDPNIINNISPTKQTRSQNTGYIAQINKEQTEIVNVFIDRKTAAIENGFESSSALDNPVKNFTLTKGFYYKLYEDCENDLREIFEEKNNSSPLLYKNGIGQYDSENNLVNTFVCKYDCIKSLKMSDKTLAKALDKNIQYNGFYYKSIGNKVKYF